MHAGHPPQQVSASIHACSKQDETGSLLASQYIVGVLSLTSKSAVILVLCGRNVHQLPYRTSSISANVGLIPELACQNVP